MLNGDLFHEKQKFQRNKREIFRNLELTSSMSLIGVFVRVRIRMISIWVLANRRERGVVK